MQNVLGDKLHQIILYGSYARGNYDNESDIDIMVLADMSETELKNYRKQVNRVASKIRLNHNIMITIALKNKKFFDSHSRGVAFLSQCGKRRGAYLMEWKNK